MGLFGIGKKKDQAGTSAPGEKAAGRKSGRAGEDEAYQKELLERVEKAEKAYKSGGDLDALTEELEYAFINAEPHLRSPKNMDLVSCYIKAGRNAEAWVYLDNLYAENEAPLDQIRAVQADMLIRDRRWADAVEMYMLLYLARAKQGQGFAKEKFVKDISPAVKKLWWPATAPEAFAGMLAGHIKKKNYREADLVAEYRRYCKKVLRYEVG